MIVNEEKFVKKYSLIYTLIVSFILLTPLSLYINHKINLQEVQTEVELKSIQAHIIKAMDNFGNHPQEIFEFPRFASFASGLYKKDFTPVYTQIHEPLPSYMPGYHSKGSNRYLITKLPDKKYFFANYLVTKTEISFAPVFFEASLIAFGIITLILLLSFYFLKSFSKPFRRVNEKLDDFIKESMHEINTPLSIINVNVDLFDALYGKNKYFNRIKSATRSLATIYNDMDYLIKQNRVEYKNEPINLYDFLQERVSYFELICQLKEIELLFTCNVEKKPILFFSTTKLQRIVDNTLSNAIKFSFAKSKIEIKLFHDKEENICLSIQDYGKGIQNPQRILERYYRENEYKNGFGIGMSIVKSIIDEAGIDLDIQSEPGKGSLFTYTFKKSMFQSVPV
ncbi:HAMP domain-containing histidine kinase [Sulfurimonas sp. SWIR-19]|uniref:sensor histidine kinase n=1 Tax=Sulfurimonas sp. SWIR-19 TaxID=2878390 RepID=UPI001CF5D39A|nr:HAMP domain-containing sensor histidine kinase [Sulfurimonas sp. SWIR-19]UCN00944.1 HAMP domain-containing histidine kinase [Sulfurimonas sp. SWIR-19]